MTMSMRFEVPHGRICQNVSKIGMQNSKWLECNGNSKFPIDSKSMRVKGAGQTLKTQNYRVKSYQNKATMLLLGFCAVVSANENKTWARLCKLSTVQSTATLNSFLLRSNYSGICWFFTAFAASLSHTQILSAFELTRLESIIEC